MLDATQQLAADTVINKKSKQECLLFWFYRMDYYF
jgi:hypothetical protein